MTELASIEEITLSSFDSQVHCLYRLGHNQLDRNNAVLTTLTIF